MTENNFGDEWITPSEIIAKAKLVFRTTRISLDPASTRKANQIVCADEFYTKEQDGLGLSWNVESLWLNPPYSRGSVGLFVDKLLAVEVKFNEAIVLVNTATDTKWFQKLSYCAEAVCFRKGRIKFVRPDTMKPSSRPRYANVFFYFGNRRRVFRDVFTSEGKVFFGWA